MLAWALLAFTLARAASCLADWASDEACTHRKLKNKRKKKKVERKKLKQQKKKEREEEYVINQTNKTNKTNRTKKHETNSCLADFGRSLDANITKAQQNQSVTQLTKSQATETTKKKAKPTQTKTIKQTN